MVKAEPRPSIVVGGSCSESNKPGVQPPDLWIHHGHLELKNFDKGERSNSPNHASIIQHTAEDQQQGDDGARPDAWGTPGGSAGQGQGNKVARLWDRGTESQDGRGFIKTDNNVTVKVLEDCQNHDSTAGSVIGKACSPAARCVPPQVCRHEGGAGGGGECHAVMQAENTENSSEK
ncbi:uncharacterized protein LOC126998820 [Eriocheir sinensis]|uniref:uncharacterized protein LOC126998820 n=1 Tax=Eriocheir sinensis TaxID=95602 RepID=UPI0021C98B7E|nr:uncharacterized protein LOC126998820 [Eriocheir sinensis]